MKRVFLAFTVFLVALNLKGVFALEVNFTSTFPFVGSEVELTCAWREGNGESANRFLFYTARDQVFSSQIGRVDEAIITPSLSGEKWNRSKMSVRQPFEVLTEANLRVADAQCSDSGRYSCVVKWSRDGNEETPMVVSNMLHVAVSKPKLSVDRGSRKSTVMAGEEIVYTCSSLVAVNDSWQFGWRVYKGSKLQLAAEDVGKKESHITEYNNCSVNLDASLTLIPSREDRDLVVKCFLIHAIHAPALTLTEPLRCKTNDLCAESRKIEVLFPVSDDDVEITMDPMTALEGNNVTLTCRAQASPPATMTWSHGGRVLLGENIGWGGSRLVLYSVQKDADSGMYSCTATNTIRHVNYSSTAQIRVYVGLGNLSAEMLSDDIKIWIYDHRAKIVLISLIIVLVVVVCIVMNIFFQVVRCCCGCCFGKCRKDSLNDKNIKQATRRATEEIKIMTDKALEKMKKANAKTQKVETVRSETAHDVPKTQPQVTKAPPVAAKPTVSAASAAESSGSSSG